MKKFTLLLLAMVAVVNMAKADVEWTIYSGSYVVGNWDKAYSIPRGILANLENGDMIYGEFTPAVTEGGYPQIRNGWNDEDILDDNPVTESGKFAYTLTSSDISANKDILIRGKNYTLTKLSIKKAKSCIKSTIPLENTPIATGNYATGGSPDFTSLSPVENDYVFVSASTVTDDGNGGTITYWKGKLGQGSTWSEELDVNGGYWHKLSSAAATALSGKWAYIQGHYLSITGLALYHPVTSFSIGSIGMATFCANVAVSVPDGIEAYSATVSSDKTKLELKKIADGIIPANTGVIIKGAAGSVVEFRATTTENVVTSDLTGVTTATTMTAGDYILYNNGGTAEFREVTATELAANKAYLSASKLVGSARIGLEFVDDETTGINTTPVNSVKVTNEYYNLAGQRVDKPTKGLYIVKGKKVIIK